MSVITEKKKLQLSIATLEGLGPLPPTPLATPLGRRRECLSIIIITNKFNFS